MMINSVIALEYYGFFRGNGQKLSYNNDADNDDAEENEITKR
jgi:hypothetical protein